MIGRALCAALLVAGVLVYRTLASAPVEAAAYVTQVKWQGNGVVTWERFERRSIPPPTVHHLTSSLPPGSSKVTSPGRPGERAVRIRYAQRDGGPVHSSVLASKVVRRPRPRIVDDGVGTNALGAFEARGVTQMSYVTRSALRMVATAYTANCAGCGGMTAIGRRAGYGIVAVDPRVIPLGTRLYIPGYGMAVAGDTGGAIIGARIDLGFDSLRDALIFGRRDVTVYRLK